MQISKTLKTDHKIVTKLFYLWVRGPGIRDTARMKRLEDSFTILSPINFEEMAGFTVKERCLEMNLRYPNLQLKPHQLYSIFKSSRVKRHPVKIKKNNANKFTEEAIQDQTDELRLKVRKALESGKEIVLVDETVFSAQD